MQPIKRLAELKIVSRPGGLSVVWDCAPTGAFSEDELLEAMKRWCARLRDTIEGEAPTLVLNLHPVVSESGGPDTLGFGYVRGTEPASLEVPVRATSLVEGALAYLSGNDG